jgi:hypothetical protein
MLGNEVMSRILGVMLVITVLLLLFRRRFLALMRGRLDRPPPRHVAKLTTITGATLGVLVTISSVGAGAIGVTVPLLHYPRLRWRSLSAPTSPTRFHRRHEPLVARIGGLAAVDVAPVRFNSRNQSGQLSGRSRAGYDPAADPRCHASSRGGETCVLIPIKRHGSGGGLAAQILAGGGATSKKEHNHHGKSDVGTASGSRAKCP